MKVDDVKLWQRARVVRASSTPGSPDLTGKFVWVEASEPQWHEAQTWAGDRRATARGLRSNVIAPGGRGRLRILFRIADVELLPLFTDKVRDLTYEAWVESEADVRDPAREL